MQRYSFFCVFLQNIAANITETMNGKKELKRLYPDGMVAFDKEHRYNLYYSLEQVEEIKALDAAEKKCHFGGQDRC